MKRVFVLLERKVKPNGDVITQNELTRAIKSKETARKAYNDRLANVKVIKTMSNDCDSVKHITDKFIDEALRYFNEEVAWICTAQFEDLINGEVVEKELALYAYELED